MTATSRRKFIKQSIIVSIGFSTLARCASKGGSAEVTSQLVSDPKQYLDLPEGFSYRVISQVGDRMSDGLLVPARSDGMGAFEGAGGKVILVRNHENSPQDALEGAFGAEYELLEAFGEENLYDAGKMELPGLGGTSTLVYDETSGQVESQYLSLAGTYRNCAGGVTPWGSWLTCEEDITRPQGNIEHYHGYVFEVPASSAIRVAAPRPIKAMGRFNHEAVAVDPETHIVYQTEDRHDGLIYRFIPDDKNDIHAGGKLQALAVKGQPGMDTRNWEGRSISLNQKLEVEWIDLENVDPEEDDLRLRGFEQGAARFARGEGMWYGNGEIYFACTNGGAQKFGQVFRLVPGTDDQMTLELFAESEDKSVLHMCDNLTIAPWGDVILAEDNGELNHIRGINKEGELYDIACNRSSGSEFAGLTFSPSGKTLFVNIQENGDTLAITGPWDKLS
ncbi:alkaline phosphatase PhoX [Roseivirga sp.]|uniref:alkaline phosphatase PhoX n=1 Tax=Roseivirga sp. TaxID=1964215 RepID=UPI003B52A392